MPERAFGKSSVRFLDLQTRLLSKKRVKKSLKTSKVKTLKIRVAKRFRGKTRKTYRKAFAKMNSGRKVKVV